MSQEFPKGWKVLHLGELQIKKNNTITPNKTEDQMFELYSVPSYSTGKPEIISGSGINSNKQTVEEETVLLCKINPHINRVWIVGNYSAFRKIASTEWIPFFKQNGIEPKYLLYFLQNPNFRNFLSLHLTGMGGSLTRIKPAVLDQYEIPIPPLPIQKKIVQKLDEILVQLDEKKKEILKIKGLSEENLKLIKTYYFRYWLSKFLVYKKSDGYNEKPFSAVTNSFDNLRVPLNKSQRAAIQGNYPYYGASGKVDSINDYKFDGKYLLIAEDGENLNSQKKPYAFIVEGKFWVNNHAHAVQTLPELDIDYLCFYLNGLRIMDYAQKQATRPKLRRSDLDKIPIIYPDITKQRMLIKKIINFRTNLEHTKNKIMNVLENQENSITHVNYIQSSILDVAFSGKLVN